jgi:hypothetical protein
MLGRRPAAAADDPHAEPLHELAEHLRHRGRLERVHGVAGARVEGQAGVRDHGDRPRRVLGQVAHRLAHVLRPGRAVQADDIDAERLERRHGAGDVGAEEHAPRDVERHLGLHRNAVGQLREQPLEAGDRRLDLENVLGRLDEQYVHAALDERLGLLVEVRGQLLEGDLREHRVGARREHAGGPHRAGDEARAVRRGVLVARRAREARRGDVDLAHLVAEAPLGQPPRRRLERARLHDVHADGEEALVNPLNDVRAREDEVVVAPLERRAPEVRRREVVPLDVRAHRPVVDEHAARELGEVRSLRGGGGALGAGGRGGHDGNVVARCEKKSPDARRRAGALAGYLTWPQVAGKSPRRVGCGPSMHRSRRTAEAQAG